jgi:hypothetical protein
MDLREIGLGGVDWIRLSQDRDRWRAVVSAVMNLRVLAPRSYVTTNHWLWFNVACWLVNEKKFELVTKAMKMIRTS